MPQIDICKERPRGTNHVARLTGLLWYLPRYVLYLYLGLIHVHDWDGLLHGMPTILSKFCVYAVRYDPDSFTMEVR